MLKSFVRRCIPGTLAVGGLTAGLISTSVMLEGIQPPKAQAQGTPSLLEFRWENSTDYKKLYYWQSSTIRRDRSTYYLMLKPKDRKTAILKLTITVPDYFNAKITSDRLSLCLVNLGGMLSRTRCKEQVPAIFEVSEDQTSIDVFPESPIPTGNTYAVVMKIFNPTKRGMFQFNALAQAPGDVPMGGYLGSWLIDIN
ncbi:MAG TPA: DUF2808 domain-containing protein [Prochlorococcus sp.]|nr:DUF2808 domain-containing protein [Prochlorococcaceae cyanobacterium ETNP18_MAG_17]MDP6320911.1 DUF2808 domain-containing protein [Prochlorococcaceae cyanobacterium ETNP14_MAG_5]